MDSSRPEIEVVYDGVEYTLDLLDESEHHSTVDLTKKLNEALSEINRLKSK